ncbi:MAG: helix-turn-helix domain-containing protein [Candidatus Hydrogenedentes bacterium]|nr:helix-turn-helix domain-containing protein [Candidatus Hydrogenedentota bacterium]
MPARASVTMPNVREIREKLGLTQTDFAKLLGVNQAAVSHWENGKRTPQGPALTLMGQLSEHGKKFARKLAHAS